MNELPGQIGEALIRLQSPDSLEREAAVKALGEHSEDEAVAGLVLALEDPDLGIRELAANYLTNSGGHTAAQLLVRFLANEDIGTRNLASEVLVKIGAGAVPALVENIICDDHDVRKFICDILGLIGDQQAVGALQQRLWDDNTNVVCSAAEALGEIRAHGVTKDLIAVSEKIDDALLPAIEAMGKIGSSDALPFLYGTLKDGDPMIQCVVIEAIGKIGNPDSVPHLAEFLHVESPEGRTIAEAALTAIIEIHQRSGGKLSFELPLDKYADFLFEGIKNGNQAVTEFTLSRLSHWFGNSIIEGLLNVVEFVDDTGLKRITDMLSEVGPAAAKPILNKMPQASSALQVKLLDVIKSFVDEEIAADLLPLAQTEDPEVRQRVAHVLGVSGWTGAIKTLKSMATDLNGHVRAAAYSALGWLCTEEDVDFIVSGLSDKYPDVREAAVGALIIIGGSKVVAKFTADLYHEDAERQRLAVTALGWIGELDVVEPLLKAINHPDPGVRKSAINSLIRIGHVTDYAPITMALNDENSAVRKSAVSALVALRGEEAVDDIRLLLEDDDVWVRYHTISAFGELGQRRYAPLVIPYLDAELDIIKLAAAEALAQMGSREAVPVLNQLKDDRNEDLASAAQMALQRIGEE